jgi:hypothetical protein
MRHPNTPTPNTFKKFEENAAEASDYGNVASAKPMAGLSRMVNLLHTPTLTKKVVPYRKHDSKCPNKTHTDFARLPDVITINSTDDEEEVNRPMNS